MGSNTTLAPRASLQARIDEIDRGATKVRHRAAIKAFLTRGPSLVNTYGTTTSMYTDVTRRHAEGLPTALRHQVNIACDILDAHAIELINAGLAVDIYTDGASRGLTDVVIIPRERFGSDEAQANITASVQLGELDAALNTCVKLAQRRLEVAKAVPWHTRRAARRSAAAETTREIDAIIAKVGSDT